MKILLASLGAALLITTTGNANAVTCAAGVRHAGCAGANGAVVARKPVTAAPKAAVVAPAPKAVVVTPAHGCRYVNGAKVCR